MVTDRKPYWSPTKHKWPEQNKNKDLCWLVQVHRYLEDVCLFRTEKEGPAIVFFLAIEAQDTVLELDAAAISGKWC